MFLKNKETRVLYIAFVHKCKDMRTSKRIVTKNLIFISTLSLLYLGAVGNGLCPR